MPYKDKAVEVEYQRRYRESHRQELRAYNFEYRKTNSELIRERKRIDYEKNSDTYKARSRKFWKSMDYWQQKHHHAMVKARASKCEIVSEESIREYYREVFSKDEQTCTYCHGVFGIKDITVDHKTPKSKGGKHEVSNFVVSCCGCNVKKHTTPYEVWVAMK